MEAMTMVAPMRSHQQRLEALRRANEIRTYRARLKREIAAGRVTPWTAIRDPRCGTMKVMELLVAVPKVGPVKANTILRRGRISPSKTIGGLTPRQLGELARALP